MNALTLVQTSSASNPDTNIVKVAVTGAYVQGTADALPLTAIADPQALNQADAQIVEDMILTAANQALGQAKQISNAEMSKVTAGFSLPGLT